eukprot:9268099-Ditylum_brightwellii.AAC.1
MSGQGGSHIRKYSASVSPGSSWQMHHQAVAAPVLNVAYYHHGEKAPSPHQPCKADFPFCNHHQ